MRILNHPRMNCRSFQVVVAVIASGRIEVALEHPVTPNRNTWFRNKNEAGDIKFWCLYPSKFGHVGSFFNLLLCLRIKLYVTRVCHTSLSSEARELRCIYAIKQVGLLESSLVYWTAFVWLFVYGGLGVENNWNELSPVTWFFHQASGTNFRRTIEKLPR